MPKAVDVDERRRTFVAAAWDVIASDGLNAATLRKVAAEAGCTTGSLTHYFPDRVSLLIEALRSAHYAAGARMFGVASSAKSPEERLRAILLEALPLDDKRLREWKVWLAFWAESAQDAELRDENARRYAEWREVVEDTLSPFCAAKDQLDARATHLMALVDGLGLQIALAGQRTRDLKRTQEACLNCIDQILAEILRSPEEGARP